MVAVRLYLVQTRYSFKLQKEEMSSLACSPLPPELREAQCPSSPLIFQLGETISRLSTGQREGQKRTWSTSSRGTERRALSMSTSVRTGREKAHVPAGHAMSRRGGVASAPVSRIRLTQFGRAEANFTFLRSGDGFLHKLHGTPLSNRLLSLSYSTYHLDFSQAARSELGTPKQIRLLIQPRPIDLLCPPDFASSPQSCPSFSVAAQVSTTPARSFAPHGNTDGLQDKTRERSTR